MTRAFKRETVLEAIKGSGANMTTISTRLGCVWETARTYVNKWKSTKEAFEAAEEQHLDRAESLIQRNIDLLIRIQQKEKIPVDSSDAKWLLSRRGKDRGYSERTDIKHEGTGEGGEIEIKQVGLSDAEREAAIQAMLGDGRLSETAD